MHERAVLECFLNDYNYYNGCIFHILWLSRAPLWYTSQDHLWANMPEVLTMWLFAFLRSSMMRLVPLTAHPRIPVADPGSGAHGAGQGVLSAVGHARAAYRDLGHREVVDQLCFCCDGCGDGCVNAAGHDWVERQLTRRADRHVG
jgi:hypothetical protein